MIKMINKSWQGFVAFLLAIAILASPAIAGIVFVNAATNAKVLDAPKVIPEIIGYDAEIYKATVIQLASTEGIINQYQLDTDNITVRDFDEAYGDGNVIAFIPINDNTSSKFSFYAARFNKKDGTLLETMAVIFNKMDNLYEGAFIKDNNKVLHLTMQEDGTIVEGWSINPDGSKTDITNSQLASRGSFWECFKQCLRDQGVPLYVISLIGSVCTFVCIDLPNPPGCSACAAATVYGLSFIAGYCLAYCY